MLSGLLWNLKYLFGNTRWDTGVVPPELVDLIEGGDVTAGRALDIGCGTGTQAIYLAQHGFDVTGADVAFIAIKRARRKAKNAGVNLTLLTSEFTSFSADHTYDFVLDIGCFHSLLINDCKLYMLKLRELLSTGSSYVLYAWGSRQMRGRTHGIAPESLKKMFGEDFLLRRMWSQEECGIISYWYWFVRE